MLTLIYYINLLHIFINKLCQKSTKKKINFVKKFNGLVQTERVLKCKNMVESKKLRNEEIITYIVLMN